MWDGPPEPGPREKATRPPDEDHEGLCSFLSEEWVTLCLCPPRLSMTQMSPGQEPHRDATQAMWTPASGENAGERSRRPFPVVRSFAPFPPGLIVQMSSFPVLRSPAKAMNPFFPTKAARAWGLPATKAASPTVSATPTATRRCWRTMTSPLCRCGLGGPGPPNPLSDAQCVLLRLGVHGVAAP